MPFVTNAKRLRVMKRVICAILFSTLCTITFVQGATRKDVNSDEHEVVVEARRSAMNFDEIEVSRAVRLIVEERTTGNIIIRAPRSVMPYLSLRVSGGTLYATILSGAPALRSSNVVAEVYVPYNGRIKDISASSAAKVIVRPTLSCTELDLDASSAAMIDVKAGAREVSIDASGASTIKAQLAADEVDVELSGASVAHLSGQVQSFEVDMSGASTLRAAKMRASHLALECSSASKAVAMGIRCNVQSSGASNVEVEALQYLEASASGASSITYSGDCQMNIISNTGASVIRKK